METMHPVVLHGAAGWQPDRLPRDEFEARMGPLRQAMAAHGWAGVLVYGDAVRYQPLAYLTQFVPRLEWAAALVPARGPSTLWVHTGPRDIPAARSETWVEDVRTTATWLSDLRAWADALTGTSPASLAIAGRDQMRPTLVEALVTALANMPLLSADTWFDQVQQRLRPREARLLREATALLQAAIVEAEAAFAAGSSARDVLLTAEGAAREAGVHDVRLLWSADGHTWIPWDGRAEAHSEHLLCYEAVEWCGYWVGRFFTLTPPGDPVAALVRAQTRDLARAVTPGLGPDALWPTDLAPPTVPHWFRARAALRLGLGHPEPLRCNQPFTPESAYAIHWGIWREGRAWIASEIVWLESSGPHLWTEETRP
ncbi:MAG: hypothetical protein K6U14_12105 [Firmicutes bacterium]|nr:hypothetical protein [Alicyclobacillaceae bacterium]MCL6498355.1 hypothetical protein [Bacillota bacterium]